MNSSNLAIASAVARAPTQLTEATPPVPVAAGRQIADTSRDALQAMSISSLKRMGDRIHAVVAAACRAGALDVSMREIQQLLSRSTGEHIDMSSISARVNALVAAKRLVRHKSRPRACSITGKDIAPLSLPVVQDRLCA